MTTRYQGFARVLRIPAGQDRDAEGRGLGDDWMLADLGIDHEGTHWYVTTDCVHASQLGGVDAGTCAEELADALNRKHGRIPESPAAHARRTQEPLGLGSVADGVAKVKR